QSLRGPLWLHVAFLAAFCLGLIPLERRHLGGGIREVVQCFAMLGVAWMLFASASAEERRPAIISLVIVCPFLMLWGAIARFASVPTPFSDARMALIVCVSFPFLINALLDHKLKLLAVPVAFALLVLGCRNGGLLLCGLLGGITCLLLKDKKQAPRLLLVAALPVVIGIIAGGSTWQTLAPRNADTGNLKRLFVEYEATPDAVADAPLTGHGLGRYKNVIQAHFVRFVDPDDNKVAPDTNSTYALLAVEAGLPAALLLVVLIAAVAVRALQRARKDIEAAAPAGAALALLFAGLFTTILTRNTGITAALALGAATAVVVRPEKASLLAWAAKAGTVVAVAAACLAVVLLPRGLVIIESNFDDESEYWVIEAEQPAAAPDGTMTIALANDASGNAVLAIPQDAGKRDGSALYQISNVPAGPCTLWLRAYWEDGCSNSTGAVFRKDHMVITDEIFRKWHWVASPRQIVAPGESFQLRLQNIEDGVMIDQILFTQDRRFVPHGILRKAGNDEE
ncbi:MAG: hypothetical protein HQ592_05335, partial [Planctomycetes bacterium]|nr:hypothetical protein [Planctomycetota bacterium]